MKPAIVTPLAYRNIGACHGWIQRENRGAARRFLDAVEHTIDEIEHMPGIGSPRYAHLIPGVRVLAVQGFEHYLIFYLEHEASVDIIRVIHGARDLPEVLTNEL